MSMKIIRTKNKTNKVKLFHEPVYNSQAVEMFKGEHNFAQIEAGRVFEENSFAFKMHEELTAAQIFQYQIEFTSCLEGIDQLNDKWMLKIDKFV